MPCDARRTPIAAVLPVVASLVVASLAGLGSSGTAFAAGSILTTDSYAVTLPRKPWRRVDVFDEMGHVAFAVPSEVSGAATPLRLSYEATGERDPRRAL